ncbi:hypothetical protein ASPWEDRAFT_169690 [Aspergillus wentii DTO 134E9]|uniref:Chromo domain-containing protein n=1 Tax=Aspergillus wentii DTO 134E9 TaxID=1073089 RepID=A0A1L9RY20_ASPWE|nr:uncharacterized protein ASPWEDRAFT_169690 [Aspergillus wentii DTO 134E9]OJJ39866.1 hypothetical protein ASPWEDRAFT_169690 [Aspergillus wentii DTO 134E9]
MPDTSDDDISITSTAPSEQLSEYLVDTVLTERMTADGMRYLVKWEGYGTERSTWESADSFHSAETLRDWNKKKRQVAEGRRPAFDLKGWQTHLIALENAKNKRRKRREAKRRKLTQSENGASQNQKENPPKKLRIETSIARTKAEDKLRNSIVSAVSTQSPLISKSAGFLPTTTFEKLSLNTNASRSSLQNDDRVKPVPQRPAAVAFGSSEGVPTGPRGLLATRHKRRNSLESKQFSLTAKWRHEKAKHYEPAPDINQLELVRPSDWPPRTGVNTAKLGGHVVSSPTGGSPAPSPRESDKLGPLVSNSPVNRGDNSRSSLEQSYSLRSRGDSWRPGDVFSSPPGRPSRPETWNSYSDADKPTGPNYNQDSRREPSPPMPPMPPRKPGPYSKFIFQDRFCNPTSELLVHVFYGRDKKEIGTARLCGMTFPCKDKLQKSRTGKRIELWFQHFCTLQQYRNLCNNTRNNFKYFNGWIEGYDDTEPGIYRMGRELERGDFVGICEFGDFVFLAYPRSSAFSFLDGGLRYPSDAFIKFAVRAPLDNIEWFLKRLSPDNSLGTREDERIPPAEETMTMIKKTTDNQKLLQEEIPESNQSLAIKGISAMKKHVVAHGQTEKSHIESPMTATKNSSGRQGLQYREEVPASNRGFSIKSLSAKKPLAGHEQAEMSTAATFLNNNDTPESFTESSAAVENPTPQEPAAAKTSTLNEGPPVEEPPLVDESLPADEPLSMDELSPVHEPIVVDKAMPTLPTGQLPVIHKPQPTENHSTAGDVQDDLPPAKMPIQAENPLTVQNFNLDAFFKENYKVTFEDLATVNGSDKNAQVFYLMFPLDNEIVQQQYQILVEFLKKHNALIYSNHLPDDWEKFRRTASRGVVLFHETFVEYHAIPSFLESTRKNFSFWTLSLYAPLQHSSRPVYFQRIFPHGGVILLTEDFMIREPDATIIVLAWFYDWSRKRFPGSWRIMLRPDVLNWLLKLPEPKEKERHGVWVTMYYLILQLIGQGLDIEDREVLDGVCDDFSETSIISPAMIPHYGSRKEDDHPAIPKGLNQEQRDADHMVEFFAGWGLVNNDRFRRFVVLTSFKPFRRWETWNHLELRYGAKDFMKNFEIDYKHYWSKLKMPQKPGSSSSDESRSQQQQQHQAPAPSVFTPRTPGVSMNEPGAPRSRPSRLPPRPMNYPQPYQ